MQQSASCPISGNKINSLNAQVNALFVSALMLLTLFVSKWFVLILVFDFGIKTFFGLPISPLCRLSALINKALKRSPVMTDEAPKRFAAVLGFVFSSLLMVFGLITWIPVAFYLTFVIFAFCAILEGLFKVCLGCYMYTFFQGLKRKDEQ